MKTKYCPDCKKTKQICHFYPNCCRTDKLASICIDCEKIRHKNYYLQNKKQISKKSQIRYEKNKEIEKIKHKEYYINNRKKILLRQKKYRKTYPEKVLLVQIKQRCQNPNLSNYKDYGLRGIKNFLIEEDIKFLMKRDNYYKLKNPSIDRKDNDGNYTLENCRFIELSKNVAKRNSQVSSKPISQYNLDGKLLKKFKNIKKVADYFNLTPSSVSQGLKKYYPKYKNFLWKWEK